MKASMGRGSCSLGTSLEQLGYSHNTVASGRLDVTVTPGFKGRQEDDFRPGPRSHPSWGILLRSLHRLKGGQRLSPSLGTVS